MSRNLYKETLMKHHRDPQCKEDNPSFPLKKEGSNPSCGDDITLYISTEEDSVKAMSFNGHGCAISIASADIMCCALKDKTLSEALNQAERFIRMVDKKEDLEFSGDFSELDVFREMQKFPARKQCALLPWKTLLSALKEL